MFVCCSQDVIIGASRIKSMAGSIQSHDSVSMGDDDALGTKRRARLLGAKRHASAGNPGRVTWLATMYSATRPLMLCLCAAVKTS